MIYAVLFEDNADGAEGRAEATYGRPFGIFGEECCAD